MANATTTSIRLPIELDVKLTELAKATERSKAFFLKKLVVDNFYQLDRYFCEAEEYKKEEAKKALIERSK